MPSLEPNRIFPHALALAITLAAASTGMVRAAPGDVSARDAARWIDRLLPLPKEVRIEHQTTVPSADVRITLADGGGALERNAVRKLELLFLEKAGAPGDAPSPGFDLLLGLCDADGRVGGVPLADAGRLRKLPNSDQAYLIRPDGANRLVLAALDSPGLFYAALTLRQLIETGFHGDDVTFPLAIVTDWPDLAERGEWGGSSVRDIEWMADRKMNLIEFHTTHEIGAQGEPITAISQALLRRGALHAVRLVPIISHLNGMGKRGVYRAWPDLRGKGEKAVHKDESGELTAPCASQPKLREILAAWMRGYARCGVRDISCWLGELNLRCQCAECSNTDQFALETRAFVAAWRLARRDYPDLRIRILTTQGSYATNDQVLAETPPGVAVTYYDGGRTYDSSRTPMIYPLLERFAAAGRTLGCYPQLTPSWRIVSPWSCPQFVRTRLTEFASKHVASLGGYVVPDNRLFDFNVSAAAEWSWNARGRDERAFTRAWATRQGFADPEAVADWAMLLGPVSWDLYAARLVERHLFRPAAIERMIKTRAKPAFGQGMLLHIPDAACLAQNLAVCRQATRLAERCGSAAIKAETGAITTYYEMLDALCRICDRRARKETPDAPADRRLLQPLMNAFALAAALNIDALTDWERTVWPGAGGARFQDGVRATADTLAALARALAPLGIRNPAPLLGSRRIGGWASEDFRAQRRIEKSFDVTELIAEAGTYLVTFQYTDGWNGAKIHCAALVADPGTAPGAAPVEVCRDEHPGSTAHRSVDNVYSLRLAARDPKARYTLAVRIEGTRPQDQTPGRTGCAGEILVGIERAPDWQVRIVNFE